MKYIAAIFLIYANAVNADIYAGDILIYVTPRVSENQKTAITGTTKTSIEESFLEFRLPVEMHTIKFQEQTLEFKIPEGIMNKEFLENMAPALLPNTGCG